MNKKQRHRAKEQKKDRKKRLARALVRGFSEWSSDLPKIDKVAKDGEKEVRERLARFLVDFLPKLGTRVIRATAKSAVFVSPMGVTIDFNECAHVILREQERRIAS